MPLIPSSRFAFRWWFRAALQDRTTVEGSLSARRLRGFSARSYSMATADQLSLSARTNLREGLAGSGPFHKSCIFLHHPDPPSKYPRKVSSDLLRSLTLRAVLHKGLVNFCWRSDDDFVVGDTGIPESYPATIFLGGEHVNSERRVFHVPNVSHNNLDVVDSILSLRDGEETQGTKEYQAPVKEQHIYVCTHGARDCRCGDTGGAVVEALRQELASRRSKAQSSTSNSNSPSIWDRIRIGEVAHVGGHKYAANVLLYPGGEWLGKITPSDVPALLDLVGSEGQEEAETHYPFVLSHSRGRMGVENDVHRQLLEHLSQSQY